MTLSSFTLSLLVLVCLAPTAHARPVVAFSDARETGAAKLRAEADALYVDGRFDEALLRYERALVLREHPTLYFSAGLCLIELADWARAAASFDAALAFDAGLTTGERQQARGYVDHAVARTALLEVGNDQGATVAVDGRIVLDAGGRTELRVMPGDHVITARRGDTETSQKVMVRAGGHARVHPTLRYVDSHARWARWKPWAVFAAGSLVAIAAAPLYAHIYTLTDRAERLAAGCIGCSAGGQHDALLADANRYGRYAAIALTAGGALALTGLVLIAANRTVHERRTLPTVGVASSTVVLGMQATW